MMKAACRGLYKRTTARTPIFLYMANRERAGKDYLRGITGLIYEGVAIENPPICNEDKYQNTSEELRKKITSSLKNGVKLLHFSNNRGKLKNVVLESASTLESWKDRLSEGNRDTIWRGIKFKSVKVVKDVKGFSFPIEKGVNSPIESKPIDKYDALDKQNSLYDENRFFKILRTAKELNFEDLKKQGFSEKFIQSQKAKGTIFEQFCKIHISIF